MRFGIAILPEYRWRDAASRWRRAEEYGFDHAWTYDHLTWAGLQDSPWYGTTPTLTAAATVTSTIKLGTFVTSPNFRHPLALTREILAIDDVSDGRFLCGIGAGGSLDATIQGGLDLTPRQRQDRYQEFVELLDILLTTDGVDFKGEYYETRNGRTLPGCIQQPRVPFILAGNGPRSLRFAAEHGDGWMTTGGAGDDLDSWFQSVADLSHRLDDFLAGRPFDRYLSLDSVVYALSSPAAFEDAVGRAAALGFTDVITHWPRAEGVYAGSEDVLEQVATDVLPRLR
ncbi:alkanesulfonate monooxygenase SsuD/methylene tetrahydromethanopterin reductase-like flavin-dependent oxidoreductase (luciferase family) [Kribbella aluminosa]|uniref:Alkanesulfonate monooxygenase SsuD/methylene tetrahydromethanopterin reductase-like flavin-dependent oxidoreductase (Luciferase family) n=1 Tax=Kribbella aluminosa TaxID=416017 RepID=A0ABS4UM48_9ACTN|nr:LLM class flavin-dependent oxidoreductase [Kribbella aluminosa]MBP2352722.1 alkanesulfonate monooxygenase SsuD/methylene tetrahydromethanopterin reductase-like flavin-dependent oxidoreductase (luciferase family) [Kribbella aluminosa]